jgi:glycosyltransferase involved in cell wall biosynthesis
VLFVAPATPASTGNGLAMRQGLFAEALARVADTEVLVLPIAGSGESALTKALGIPTTIIPIAGRADTNFRLLTMVQEAAERLAAFRSYGRGSRHAAVSLPVLQDVGAATRDRQFDLVHCGRLYVAEAGLSVAATSHTIDLDEDDAYAWRLGAQLDRAAGRTVDADWAEAEAEAEDRLLARTGGRCDTMFIAGAPDRDRIVARHPNLAPEVVANAVEWPANPQRHDDGNTLLFVGSLGYAPNVEGLLWFASQVLPRILAHRTVRLRIVGRGSSARLAALREHPQIDLVGGVDDVSPFYATATLAIAPLRSGAGTRIKLIEAAAFEVPVVATSIAAQGLDFGPASRWEADAPDAFAAAVLAALTSPEERIARARRARAVALSSHDRERIVDALAQRFVQIIDRARATPVL